MHFSGKKFVVIVSDQIASRNLAYVGALIGFQFGRKIPEMVGRDQIVPSTKKFEGSESYASYTHLGITTQNLPVLNGLGYENMRTILEGLKKEESLLVTEVTDAVATSHDYEKYAKAIATTPTSETNYWGIGVFGDAAIINKYTEGLRLYGKQPKMSNLDPTPAAGGAGAAALREAAGGAGALALREADTICERRLSGGKSDLPIIRLILANNLSGGELANTAVILGVTYGKLYGDRLFGGDLTTHGGRSSLGLPMVDLSILNGHSASNPTMRELREKLHDEAGLSVVDVTDATGKTRSYEDYLALAENTSVLQTTYWGIGICGASALVAKYTAGLGLYITSSEEQALIKKEESARKMEARRSEASKQTVAVASNKERFMGAGRREMFANNKAAPSAGASATAIEAEDEGVAASAVARP